MDKGGVDKAVVCSLGQAIDNEYVAEAVRRFPDRLIGFCEVNPRDPNAVQVVRHAVEVLGLRGLKLHPLLMAHPVMSLPLMGPIFEVCQVLDIPIYGHCMADIPTGNGSWLRARTWPSSSASANRWCGRRGLLEAEAAAGKRGGRRRGSSLGGPSC